MGKSKSDRKILRMNCPSCGNVQDSLNHLCSSCKQELHPEKDLSDQLDHVRKDVAELEDLLIFLSDPKKAATQPYRPVDTAYRHLRGLRKFSRIPGMPAYLAATKEKLHPFKIRMLKNTAIANLIFCAFLLLFPLITTLMKWSITTTAILALPAAVWCFISFKALSDLKKAEREFSQKPDEQ